MEFHFGRATGIMLKTLPYVAVRIGVGVLFGLFTLLYFGVVAAVVWFLGDAISGLVQLVVFLGSFGIFLYVLRLLRQYVLYLVSAAHVATIAHAVDTGEVPENQLSFGKRRVSDNFAEASALFAVDRLVRSVLNQFNSAVISLSNLVDFVPGLKQILTILRRAVSLAGQQLDEAILAYVFLHEEQGNWTAARDGLVLYAKTWKPVLATAVVIVVGMYAVAGGAVLLVSPFAGVFGQLSPVGEIAGWAAVLGIVATLHFGLVGPWVKTVIVTTFLIESRDETPDSETMDYIESKAGDFRAVVDNAAEEDDGEPASPGDPEATASD